MAETLAAEKRGALISKELVSRQAAYILITLRQAILNFPTRYARHILGLSDERQAKEVLTKAAHEFLTELSDFPQKCVDPNWLKIVEADGQGDGQPTGKPLRPATGAEIRAEQAKAKNRRKAKTQTMRKLRAKGKIA